MAIITKPYTFASGRVVDGTQINADFDALFTAAGGAVLTTDARLSDARLASDVYAWAKAAAKPTYSAAEVGALPLAGGTITGSLAVGTTLDVAGIITTRTAAPDDAANPTEGLRMCYASYSTEYRNSIFNEVTAGANSGLMEFRVNSGNSTQTKVMQLWGSGDIWGAGNISGLSFTDRTPIYEGDALAELIKVKGIDGKIDHSTLPTFARHVTKSQVASETEKDKDGKALMVETQEEGRDLGAMISMLTVAIKQLNDRLLTVEKKG